jgi:hypothetical protein
LEGDNNVWLAVFPPIHFFFHFHPSAVLLVVVLADLGLMKRWGENKEKRGEGSANKKEMQRGTTIGRSSGNGTFWENGK